MQRLFVFTLGVLTLTTWPNGACAADAVARKTFEVESHKDVAYYEGDKAHPVKHKLDMFLPKGHKDYPVLFFVHGGAWRKGDKNYLGVYSGLGKCYAQNGVGAVVINYRLSPDVKHPEHVKDVARAFAWTHKNLPRHGGRADQIFACGHSAGGHLVSLLASDESYLKAEGLTAKNVRAVIPMSGVYELPGRAFVDVFGLDADARKQASPLHHARPGLPPFLIVYADNDFPGCTKDCAERFAAALKDKGNAVKTLEVADSNHYHVVLSAGVADKPVCKEILSFIAAQSKP